VDDTELGRSQNVRYLVAKVDAGNRTVRAEDPKNALQMELKAGECYFFRVEIVSGFAKAHGRLVGLSREERASELKQLTPIDPSHVKDTSEVLEPEQAASVAAGCAAGQAGSKPLVAAPGSALLKRGLDYILESDLQNSTMRASAQNRSSPSSCEINAQCPPCGGVARVIFGFA
jgi:hypothetical protein